MSGACWPEMTFFEWFIQTCKKGFLEDDERKDSLVRVIFFTGEPFFVPCSDVSFYEMFYEVGGVKSVMKGRFVAACFASSSSSFLPLCPW